MASYPIYNAQKLYVFKLKYTTANVVIYADILCFHLQYFFCSLNFFFGLFIFLVTSVVFTATKKGLY